jgi:plasmid stabilization system protein ParE
MKYRVLWTKVAKEQLAEIWTTSDHRRHVAVAANAVDVLLGRMPQLQGESREDDRRVMFEWPLVDYFRIDEDGKRVIVSHIRPM